MNIDFPTKKSILDLEPDEARCFFLKSESYCSIDFPAYIKFDSMLDKLHKTMEGKKPNEIQASNPRNYDGVNYTIMSNKDGKYAWRPLQIIHPVLYISLINEITKPENWKVLQNRFKEFSGNKNINCLSLPVMSLSDEKDKAEQISQWWQEVEQRSIEMSLDYVYLLDTDVTDCYGAIYIHSIAWAIHSKEVAKNERKNKKLLGNVIDSYIQDMSNGQTNGIPQGSVLMDFIAEIVLGFADLMLSEKIDKSGVTDYFILRYRDDYRIFVNNPQNGEVIFKMLAETMIDLNLKLSSGKTKSSADVIRSSVKAEKLSWIFRKNSEKNLQKHLFIIHDHSNNHPNAGSLVVALHKFRKRIYKLSNLSNPVLLIAMIADIAFRNPKCHAVCAAILSKIISLFRDGDSKKIISEKIKRRFEEIPNSGHALIWMQRITYPFFGDMKFSEALCEIVSGEEKCLWNCDWVSKEIKEEILKSEIIDKKELASMDAVIPGSEVDLFKSINY